MSPLVSIIVPVYNAEDYLQLCVGSLTNQTLRDIEIILVNDGSRDKSASIIDTFAQKDSRIKAFHKPNGGLADARNYALQHATGNYIYFVDNDDFIEPNALELLYDKAQSTGCEIVMSSFDFFDKNFRPATSLSFFKNAITKLSSSVYTPDQIYDIFFDLMFYPWCALYKLSLLRKYNEPFPRMLYDDNHWCTFYRLRTNKITAVDKPIYHYRINEKSVTGSGKFMLAHNDIISILGMIENSNTEYLENPEFLLRYNRFKAWNLNEHIRAIVKQKDFFSARKYLQKFRYLLSNIPQKNNRKYRPLLKLVQQTPTPKIYFNVFMEHRRAAFNRFMMRLRNRTAPNC